MTAREFFPGERVQYRSHPFAETEHGTVVRWNDSGTLVFVQFEGAPQAKACHPRDLIRRVS